LKIGALVTVNVRRVRVAIARLSLRRRLPSGASPIMRLTRYRPAQAPPADRQNHHSDAAARRNGPPRLVHQVASNPPQVMPEFAYSQPLVRNPG
jgi:hypothetical protein